MTRNGDPIPVLVQAADGYTYVWHTPEEWARLWRGVDREAAEAISKEKQHG